MKATGKRVFITGGAHGIGRSMVETFTDAGAIVAFCDIDQQLGQKAATATGSKFFAIDVCDQKQLESCMQELIDQWGDIDVIINNVGIGIFKPITEQTIEEFDRVINTNMRSAYITSRFLACHRSKQDHSDYGRIINLCSSRYLMSESGTESYSASKGAIFSLTHALSISLAPYHITVNAIAPGWIHVNEDELLRPEDHEFHPSGRVGIPEDISRMALFLCQDGNDFINGQTITIDGGVTRKMIYPE